MIEQSQELKMKWAASGAGTSNAENIGHYNSKRKGSRYNNYSTSNNKNNSIKENEIYCWILRGWPKCINYYVSNNNNNDNCKLLLKWIGMILIIELLLQKMKIKGWMIWPEMVFKYITSPEIVSLWGNSINITISN